MWCPKCQHGHLPDADGKCPCRNCGYQLEDVLDIGKTANASEEISNGLAKNIDFKEKLYSITDKVNIKVTVDEEEPVRRKRGRPKKK